MGKRSKNREITPEEKYNPHRIAWIVLNQLSMFDDKPDIIKNLSERFNKLTTHSLYRKFPPLYEEAVIFFEKHNKFPGIDYLNQRFSDGRVLWEIDNSTLSIDMVDELRKQLDYELLIQDFNNDVGNSPVMNIEGCRFYGKLLTKFAENNVEIPLDVKEDWINSYDNFEKDYHGISTGIRILDEQVGDLGGVVTIAAPSGNGKSTFALSLAYNITTLTDDYGIGRNVLYISFEMTKFQLQANLVSIESSFCDDFNARLKATDIKEKKLDKEGKQRYRKYMNDYMQRLNHSGGYLSLMDNTAMTGYTTIEEFMATIEEHSAKVGKKFDIIFIDNVDSLKMLRGERGQDDMGKMNSFITKLDSFSKTYMDGYGTCIVLLSQTNRDGFKKLKAMEANGSQEITIDFTVLQQYSALYERATMVLVLYSSAVMRANNQLKLMPVKLRNKPLPQQPLTLTTRWEYAYVGGLYNPPKPNEDEQLALLDAEYSEEDDDEFMASINTGITGGNNEVTESNEEDTEDYVDDITLDD